MLTKALLALALHQTYSISSPIEGVQLVHGQIHIADGMMETTRDILTEVVGVYLAPVGRLSLLSSTAGALMGVAATDSESDTASSRRLLESVLADDNIANLLPAQATPPKGRSQYAAVRELRQVLRSAIAAAGGLQQGGQGQPLSFLQPQEGQLLSHRRLSTPAGAASEDASAGGSVDVLPRNRCGVRVDMQVAPVGYGPQPRTCCHPVHTALLLCPSPLPLAVHSQLGHDHRDVDGERLVCQLLHVPEHNHARACL